MIKVIVSIIIDWTFDHLTFCLMFLDSTDYDSVWSKVSQMTWNLLSNSQGSPNHDVIVNKMFSEKHETQKIGIIRKTIWFWSTFNKEPRVNSDVTRRYRMLKFVEVGGENVKIEVFGLYSANYYCVSWIPFIKCCEKDFSTDLYFSILGFIKNS